MEPIADVLHLTGGGWGNRCDYMTFVGVWANRKRLMMRSLFLGTGISPRSPAGWRDLADSDFEAELMAYTFEANRQTRASDS